MAPSPPMPHQEPITHRTTTAVKTKTAIVVRIQATSHQDRVEITTTQAEVATTGLGAIRTSETITISQVGAIKATTTMEVPLVIIVTMGTTAR